MQKKVLVVLILIACFCSGCVSIPKVDDETLVQLYAEQRKLPKKNPVIFIPGIMGTVLKDRDTGRTAWGKFGGELIIGTLALPIDAVTVWTNRDNLISTQLIERFTWVPGLVEKEVYEGIRRGLGNAGGYVEGRDIFILTYDWRRDLVEASKQLGELIDEVKRRNGQPDLKFDLVCHSAGGLIARYYAKYGTEDVLGGQTVPEPNYAGSKNINMIIMLGTPNRGSLESFERIHSGLHIPTLSYFNPEVLFTMPSLYELFPYDDEPLFINPGGLPMDASIYAPGDWEKYGWSVFNRGRMEKVKRGFEYKYGPKEGEELYLKHIEKEKLFLAAVLQRAQNFHKALWLGNPDEEKKLLKYILLGSDCQPTPRRAVLRRRASKWETLFGTHDPALRDIVFGFGDRSVTKESFLGVYITEKERFRRMPSAYEIFVCESHTDLPKSPTYMDNILHALMDEN